MSVILASILSAGISMIKGGSNDNNPQGGTRKLVQNVSRHLCAKKGFPMKEWMHLWTWQRNVGPEVWTQNIQVVKG